MELDKLQEEVAQWAAQNFPTRNTNKRLIGMTEEIGEFAFQKLEELLPFIHMVRQLGRVAHHHNKQLDGIRGSYEFHDEKIQDALGDIFLFMTDYCELKEWKIADVIQKTWNEVKQRDWIENPLSGMKRHKEQGE
jgi:NTP pyrophosphatase (non-canonical NTP hydrolase)